MIERQAHDERIDRMQRIIDAQIAEIERLQRRPAWLPTVAALGSILGGMAFMAGAILLAKVFVTHAF